MNRFDVTTTFDENDAFPKLDSVFDPKKLCTIVRFDVITTFDENDAFPKLDSVFDPKKL